MHVYASVQTIIVIVYVLKVKIMAIKLFGKNADNFEHKNVYKCVAYIEHVEGRKVVTLVPLYYINNELGVFDA